MISFWAKSEIFTPALCRMMARKKGGRPMTTLDIADASVGLVPAEIEIISQSTSWESIDLPTMREYLIAIRMDFCDWENMHRAFEYLKSRPSFEHLRRGKLKSKSKEGRRLYDLDRKRSKKGCLSDKEDAELMILQFKDGGNSSEWKSYWLPLMKHWRRSYGVVTKQSDIYPPLRDLLMRTAALAK